MQTGADIIVNMTTYISNTINTHTLTHIRIYSYTNSNSICLV